MEISWEHNGETRRSEIEGLALPYVEALGRERAAKFLIEFGGTAVYLAKTARKSGLSPVIAIIGQDGIDALRETFGSYIERAPMARGFVCRQLRSQGMTVNAIARAVGLTDVSVRKALKSQIGRCAK